MKLGISQNNLSSTLCIAAACAAAILAAGSSVASAKVLRVTPFFSPSCDQGTCSIGGGTCITNSPDNSGLRCACNTQLGSCALTN